MGTMLFNSSVKVLTMQVIPLKKDCQGVHLQEVLVNHRQKCLDFIRLCLYG